jgi:nucleotide-binding universal stress UspA family protein
VFRRVLIPIDESPLGEWLVACGAAFGEAFGARIALLHAYNWSERFAMVDAPTLAVAADEGGKEAEQARILLEARAAPLRERGLTVETVIMDSPAAEAIVTEARREPETLVVLGAHERGWLARLVRGSTLQEVLHAFDVPVLVVPEASAPHPAG